ncbi:ketohexokinase [Novimethylophilus kurashikiensis]|uniref:Ketohexokinase n=1 Tax=Novimethylophilus kurashikiensis TaxID=1825523 RepID=A0A2R5FBB0_9PROT|nr:PfkB family carbohydrate kinase [Novimethylophilus kurashikiensis]GBG15522.1 ketohexokinase [Novimethylophilus kurashikiensis]
MTQILLVGTATLDIVFQFSGYPSEDAEVRANGLRMCRGGNASNTAVVLSQLGHRCSFVGVLADVPETAVILDDFARFGINASVCPRVPGRPPTSSIQLTPHSRTIVHYRDLPELTAEQFATVDLSSFGWVHFEGRNVPELLKMLALVKAIRPDLPISIEIEKPREGIDEVFRYASLLIASKGFAASRGFDAPESFLQWLRSASDGAEVVVAWGEFGAFGIDGKGMLSSSCAYPPKEIIDTLGAGDTFNAGVLSAMINNMGFSSAIEQGCRLAGKKCGFFGFHLAQ